MTRPQNIATEKQKKTLLIAVHAPYNPIQFIQSYYDEFVNLVKTNNIQYDSIMYVTLRSIDSTYFFTKGKLKDITEFCEKEDIARVIISEPLTGHQERNLSIMFHLPVIDRTKLILQIFEQNAHSAEGKLQVAIALFEYEKSRLAGRGITMSQQGGKIGSRGPGETAKEVEKRHLTRLIDKAKRDLEQIENTRDVQRKQRLAQSFPLISLVGYTNAGKSTVLNTLTHSTVLAEDKPFATLDITTRELYIDGKKKAILSDTVGFIQLLPHHLIKAFKSTLSELQYADLLLHVIDIADQNWQSHIAVVMLILKDLGIDKPMLYIFNKKDKLSLDTDISSINNYQPHVLISANSKEDIQPLVDFLRNWHNTL